MARVSLGIVTLLAVCACGQTERDRPTPRPTGGAGVDASGGGSASDNAGAGGVAEMGGLAGTGGLSPVQSAVAECQQYCETLSYRLPQALCEDWNRSDWEPPFCDLPLDTSCADYCGEAYEAVSPSCAALLQPVIRCVAPYYMDSVLTPCWLADCRDELYTMTSGCYGLQERLDAARATWQASGIVDYELTYPLQNDVKVHVVVREGEAPVVTPSQATVWTVPKLFDAVEHYLHLPGFAPLVTYDATLGYVVDLAYQHGCDGHESEVTGVELTPLP